MVKRTALAAGGKKEIKKENNNTPPKKAAPQKSHAKNPNHTPTKGSKPTDPTGGSVTEREQRPKTKSHNHAISLAASLPRLVGTVPPTGSRASPAVSWYRPPYRQPRPSRG